MVSSTDGIGRLIADEVLLQAERQLLRGREQSSQQPEQKPTAQPIPAPISYNDKAVASVLLTLLDEQLDAAANPNKLSHGFASETSASEAGPAASRIASQYAEADAVFRADAPTEPPMVPLNATNQQVLLAAASPELRMAMQNAFFSAAVRAQTETGETAGREARRRTLSDVADLSSVMRIGAIVIAGLALAVFLVAGLAN